MSSNESSEAGSQARAYRRAPVFLKKRIKENCETHVRDGWGVNLKKVYRLYRELGQQLRNKTPKRRVRAKLREDRAPAIRLNNVWAMDFAHDQLATSRKLRILTLVDTYSRLSSVVDPRFNGAMTWLPRWNRHAGRSAARRRSGSTTAASSSPVTWICGLTSAV